MKIICGFQTGVDIAAARAAKAVGFGTGGWMPAGFRTLDENMEDGAHPEYADLYGAKETPSREWTERTEWNVRDSDATLILTLDLNTFGTKAAGKAIRLHKKPSRIIVLNVADMQNCLNGTGVVASLSFWLSEFQTVNIAGNRYRWLEDPIEKWLTTLFKCCQMIQEMPEDDEAESAKRRAAHMVVGTRPKGWKKLKQ